jgi:DNA-binding CsgD family transcriptional regulator
MYRSLEDSIKILMLLTATRSAGLSTAQHRTIAENLGISHRAVRYHLKQIYAELDVSQRSEAIVWAVRAGWAW